jgi:hypothetical protein
VPSWSSTSSAGRGSTACCSTRWEPGLPDDQGGPARCDPLRRRQLLTD